VTNQSDLKAYHLRIIPSSRSLQTSS